MNRARWLMPWTLLALGACREVCESADVNARGAALLGEIARWSPSEGRPPGDFSTSAASIPWQACSERLPGGFRTYLDLNVPHRRPPWAREGRVEPASTDWNPVESWLPGHERFHRGTREEPDPQVVRRVEAVCPGAVTVARHVASVPARARSAALFDRCGIRTTDWLTRDAFIELEVRPYELTGLALHDTLVEHGVDRAVADGLSLEILRGMRRPESEWELELDGVVLPPITSGAEPIRPVDAQTDSLLYVDRSSVRSRSRVIVERRGTGPLRELAFDEPGAVARGLDPLTPDVLLVADARARWTLVHGVAEALRSAGGRTVRTLGLVDHPTFRLQTAILPRFDSSLPPETTLGDALERAGHRARRLEASERE